jgi:hypothetical protein
VGAHRQATFTGFGVDTIALFPDLFSKTLVDGDTDDSCHQRLISESRFLRLHHSSQEVLSVHPLKIAKEKKNQPIPGQDQPLAPKTHTVLETRKQKGKKNECEVTFKRIISPRQFCQAKPTAERKTNKALKSPKKKSKKVSSTRQPQQQQQITS